MWCGGNTLHWRREKQQELVSSVGLKEETGGGTAQTLQVAQEVQSFKPHSCEGNRLFRVLFLKVSDYWWSEIGSLMLSHVTQPSF